jgi:hypothetical protein
MGGETKSRSEEFPKCREKTGAVTGRAKRPCWTKKGSNDISCSAEVDPTDLIVPKRQADTRGKNSKILPPPTTPKGAEGEDQVETSRP